MKLKFIAAAAALAVLPLCAQAQQPPADAPKATNADAQRVVRSITADKAKTQAYCDLAKLGDAMEQAQQAHDDKKLEELAQQAGGVADRLGPEWDDLMRGLQTVDETSTEGKAIGDTLGGLDKLCN